MSNARQLAANLPREGGLSSRNLIVNGACTVAQRASSVTGVTGGGYYVCDRFNQEFGSSGTWTISQSTDAPNGFRNSAKWECTASTAQGGTTFAVVEQRLEKQNLAHLQYGTVDAKDVTLSFWVKSNKIGDYNCNIQVWNNTNADRQNISKYTINSADTWEYKTITFEGDTSLDLLVEENYQHVQLDWWLGGGTTFTGNSGIGLGWQNHDNTKRANETVNLADTIGNYWQITGVQLEVGDTATPFEHRSYGDEIQRCMRYYYQKDYSVNQYEPIKFPCWSGSASTLVGEWVHPVTMRANPSLSHNGVGNFRLNDSRGNDQICTSITRTGGNVNETWINFGGANATFTIGYSGYMNTQQSNDAQLYFDAEL